MELNGKKVLVVCTTDNMIWQFLLPSINMFKKMGAEVHCAVSETGFWFNEIPTKADVVMHKMPFERSPFKPANIKAYKQTLSEQWEELPPMFISSSEKFTGREEILTFIDSLLTNY